MNKLEVVAWISMARSKSCRIWFGDEASAKDWAEQQKLEIEPLVTLESAQSAIAQARQEAFEEAAKLCDEMKAHWTDYKDTALLNNDIQLSLAASGEPRAAEFLATRIRALGKEQG